MTDIARTTDFASAPARERFPTRVLLAVLVTYACLLPREFTFEVVEIAIQPYRVVLVLLFPLAIFLIAQQRLRPSLVDFLVIFAAIWAFMALWITASLRDALITGLSEGFNLALAYVLGRASIRTSRDLQRYFYAVLPGLLVCAAVLAVESISHQHLLRPFLANLLGAPQDVLFYDVRLGLMRSMGPFPHPILGGVFMASFLPIAWYMAKGPVGRALGLLAIAGFFFTVSSTSMMGFIVSAGLIFTAFLHRVTKLPVFQAVIGGMLLMFLFIEVFSQSGIFSFIIRRLTFSSSTGYYRMAIWEYAGADAMRHPIFGIGMRNYERPAWMVPASVDAHWLLLALRYGLPYCFAVLGVMLSSAAMSLRGAWSPYALDRRAAFAIGFSLISLIVTGLSVFLWEGLGIWMSVLMGIGVTFGQQMAVASRLGPAASTSHRSAPIRGGPRLAPGPA